MTGANHEPVSLAEIEAGRPAVVRRSPRGELRLQELGLVPGQRVRVVRRGALRGPIIVEVEGARFCLRRREAEAFQVQPE